jgi:cytochrome b561
MWRNSAERYGAVAVALHWLVAAAVAALFCIGLWMTGLTYYNAWYTRGPAIHKGIGVLLFGVLAVRLLWRLVDPPPPPEPGLSPLERRLARLVHGLLYGLLFATPLCGYLISTADGRPVEVFGLFAVPATLTGLPNQADLCGRIHLALAVTAVSLAALHALAALKHHFVDRDRTLLRMLGIPPRRP